MRTMLPATYQDPAPGPMGWEIEIAGAKLEPNVMLALERRAAERSDLTTIVGMVRGAGEIPELIEKSMRSDMPFDRGWSHYVVERRVYGETLVLEQLVGNCVGAGHVKALARRIAHEIYAMGQLEEPLGTGQKGMPFLPYSYGVGRHEAGIRGNSDGSTCEGQFRGTERWGFLPCFIPGLEKYVGGGAAAFPQGTAAANKLFGRSIDEARKWADHAKKFILENTVVIESWEDLWEAVVDKKLSPMVCSGYGFKFWREDPKYGPLYRIGGSWAHNMTLPLACEFKGEGFGSVDNQWGEGAHVGNEILGIPRGAMAVPAEEIDRLCRGGHCVAVGDISGLKTALEF